MGVLVVVLVAVVVLVYSRLGVPIQYPPVTGASGDARAIHTLVRHSTERVSVCACLCIRYWNLDVHSCMHMLHVHRIQVCYKYVRYQLRFPLYLVFSAVSRTVAVVYV